MAKKLKSITIDNTTLIHAYVLANLFHGSNISALITNLINNAYIQHRGIITEDDIKLAETMVNTPSNKGNRKKKDIKNDSSIKSADGIKDNTELREIKHNNESEDSNYKLLNSILLLLNTNIEQFSAEEQKQMLQIIKLEGFSNVQKQQMISNLITKNTINTSSNISREENAATLTENSISTRINDSQRKLMSKIMGGDD